MEHNDKNECGWYSASVHGGADSSGFNCFNELGMNILPVQLKGKTIADCYELDLDRLVIEFTDGEKIVITVYSEDNDSTLEIESAL